MKRTVRFAKVGMVLAGGVVVIVRTIHYIQARENMEWTPYVMGLLFGIALLFTGLGLVSDRESEYDPADQASV